jgi:hypothetical protein
MIGPSASLYPLFFSGMVVQGARARARPTGQPPFSIGKQKYGRIILQAACSQERDDAFIPVLQFSLTEQPATNLKVNKGLEQLTASDDLVVDGREGKRAAAGHVARARRRLHGTNRTLTSNSERLCLRMYSSASRSSESMSVSTRIRLGAAAAKAAKNSTATAAVLMLPLLVILVCSSTDDTVCRRQSSARARGRAVVATGGDEAVAGWLPRFMVALDHLRQWKSTSCSRLHNCWTGAYL